MKKSRFTESQIVAVLHEYDAGTPIVDLARRHGIHANTVRLWKSRRTVNSKRPFPHGLHCSLSSERVWGVMLKELPWQGLSALSVDRGTRLAESPGRTLQP
jgi:hypothetical protein